MRTAESTSMVRFVIVGVLLGAGAGALARRAPAEPTWPRVEIELAQCGPGRHALPVYGVLQTHTLRERVIDGTPVRTFVLARGDRRVRVFSTAWHGPQEIEDPTRVFEMSASGTLVRASELAKLAHELGIRIDEPYAIEAGVLRHSSSKYHPRWPLDEIELEDCVRARPHFY